MKYQIGALLNPKPDDQEIIGLDEAEKMALAVSNLGYNRVQGIWTSQGNGGHLVGIAFDGEVFYK
jgi:hypothetical protein